MKRKFLENEVKTNDLAKIFRNCGIYPKKIGNSKKLDKVPKKHLQFL